MAASGNAGGETIGAMRADELGAMIAADERHWWYRGRRRVLRAVLDDLPLPRPAQILDAGCGSGRTLDMLAGYGEVRGLDVSAAAARATRERGHDVRVARVEAMPFDDGTFDLVTCLDVLEHIPDEGRALGELRRVTRPGGVLVLTVPAYPRLWSEHDVVNEHLRRYTGDALSLAGERAGWKVARSTHFNAALVAPAAMVRTLRRGPLRTSRSELSLTPPALDRVLELPLRAEAAAIRRGVRIPAGLSLLAVLVSPAVRRASLRADASREAARAALAARRAPVAPRRPRRVAGSGLA